MSRQVKLYEKALRNPKGLAFDELCRLAEYAGFSFARQKGSHKTYKNTEIHDRLDQQITISSGKHGEAKPYQVRDLLDLIEKYDLIVKGRHDVE